MDPVKDEPGTNVTTLTTTAEHGKTEGDSGPGPAQAKKAESPGPVDQVSTTPVQTPVSSTDSSNAKHPPEGQGSKRQKEGPSVTTDSSQPLSEDTVQSPKAKKPRKDDEEVAGGQGKTTAVTTSQDTVCGADSRPPLDSSQAPKVPPIKIVLQSHGNGTGETESASSLTQTPIVVTTSSSSPFPYIVTSADSSGIPASAPLNVKEKTRGEESKSREDVPSSESGKEKQRENEAGKSSTLQLPVAETLEQQTKISDSLSVAAASGASAFAEDRATLDGTQSPSLLGKDKPTRVTRSSQRMASNVHPSPATSPKTSTCSSPTQLDINTPGNEAASGGGVQDGVDSPSVGGGKAQEVASEVHPRKRKLKTKEKEPPKEVPPPPSSAASNVSSSSSTSGEAAESLAQSNSATTQETAHPILNCVEMYLNIRKQIERRRQSLFPVQPKPPQGFKDYLMNRGTYVLSTTPNAHLAVPGNALPPSLAPPLKDLFLEQEKERHRLRLQQVVEKEKLVLSVEQEILRVHGRAARALSNQALPFSVCTFLKDEEVYNLLTPEQEEKDRNVRSRYNGRLFLSWLQDVDDKWEKIKESMVLRHHNEAESLYAVQKMDWEWKMKEVGLCEPKATPIIDEFSVPMVFVSDDFDLLPA